MRGEIAVASRCVTRRTSLPTGRRDHDPPPGASGAALAPAAAPPGESAEVCIYLTIWMWAGFWLGAVTYAVAWFWGGRLERFGAAILLVYSAILTMNFVLTWDIGGVYLTGRIANCVRLLIFVGVCFRSNRWWPFLMTAAMGLMVVVDVVGLLNPAVSPRDAASARIGLGYLVDLALLLGVGERILAGEAPASRAAWARTDIVTAARRNRKKGRIK